MNPTKEQIEAEMDFALEIFDDIEKGRSKYMDIALALTTARIEGRNAERERIVDEIKSVFVISQGAIAMRDFVVRMIRGETERGAETMTDIPEDMKFFCDLCSRQIVCDAVVSKDEWARISPSGDEGGMLCASCMVDRLGYISARITDAHGEIHEDTRAIMEARDKALEDAAERIRMRAVFLSGIACADYVQGMLEAAAILARKEPKP